MIKKKNLTNAEGREKAIEEIKRAGFDHSAWKLQEDFTEEQFKGRVRIESRGNRQIYSGRWFLIGVLCLLPVLFKKSFETFVNSILVKPILSGFNAGTFADVVFLIVLIGFTCWLIYGKFMVRRMIDWPLVLLLLLSAIYVGLYRSEAWDFDVWSFMSLHHYPALKYVDAVLIASLFLLIYKLLPARQVRSATSYDPNYKLHDDSHITSVDDDTVHRDELAEYVAKHIVNTNTVRSFAIGINAKWGDGKTSFQKLVAEYLHEYDREILTMEFNPWKSHDEQKMVDDFFREYAALLRQYDFRLGGRLIDYSKNLTDQTNSWWSGVFGFFQELGSPGDQQDEIDKALARVNRKVVVFIDDLDRLSTDEIMELVKLIRNSANFRNTFFIVGFDRYYLQEALAKRTQYGQLSFLEKIFQLQLDLSHIPDGLIRDTLEDLLLDRLKDYTEALELLFNEKKEPIASISDVFDGKVNSLHFVPRFLTNLRDIKRFSNFFSIGIQLVGNEVVFEEYFYVALLRFKFPLLASRIRRNRLDCFKSDAPNTSFPYKSIDEANIKKLCREEDVERIDALDQDLVCEMLSYLFAGGKEDRRSVIYPDKFDLYFDNSLGTQQLLFSEFVSLLDKDWPEIQYQAMQWIEEKKAGYMIDILNSIDAYSNISRTEKVAKLWVLLINCNQYTEISTEAWLKLIGDKVKLHLFGSEGPMHLVRQLFETKGPVFFFTTYILRLVLRKYIDGTEQFFPLSKVECQAIAVNRLREFTNSRREFDRRVFEFFYYNCWESKENDNVILMKEADEVVLGHINKYPTQYLRFVIRSLSTPNIDSEYTFEPFIPQYFGSWDAFEEFLNMTVQASKMATDEVEADLKTFKSEFDPLLDYYKLFKASGYRSFASEKAPPWIEIDENTRIATLKHFKDQTYNALVAEYREAH